MINMVLNFRLQKTVGETLPAKKAGQIMVPIKIELQPEGGPGGDSQIAQPQLLVDEVEIVVVSQFDL